MRAFAPLALIAALLGGVFNAASAQPIDGNDALTSSDTGPVPAKTRTHEQLSAVGNPCPCGGKNRRASGAISVT